LAAVFDRDDFDAASQIVEEDAIVADAEPQFR